MVGSAPRPLPLTIYSYPQENEEAGMQLLLSRHSLVNDDHRSVCVCGVTAAEYPPSGGAVLVLLSS